MIRPWYHVGNHVQHNPVVVEGQQYCLHCKEWESAVTENRYEGQIFANKQWCKKCGRVISYSVYGDKGDPTLRSRAQSWATSRERTPEGGT